MRNDSPLRFHGRPLELSGPERAPVQKHKALDQRTRPVQFEASDVGSCCTRCHFLESFGVRVARSILAAKPMLTRDALPSRRSLLFGQVRRALPTTWSDQC
jgi:hypothetical protein